jgi:spore coat protein CotF
MNENIVQNPKTEVESSIDMNDKDMLTDILTTEKYLCSNYATVLNELSNEHLHKEIESIFKETREAQRKVFNLMFKKGWYTLEKADDNKISQKYQEYNNMTQELQKGE